MKKLSFVLAMILVFTSVFSICAGAAGETRTEKFFADIEKTGAITLYEPMKSENTNKFSENKVSMRQIEDENGKVMTEYFSSSKVFFLDIETYAIQKGLFMYFPQFNRHLDFSLIFDNQIKDVFEELLYEETELMPLPSYPEYMSLKSSVKETDVAGYGDIYIETFTYDTEAVVNDLVAKKIIPNPALYGISLDDNEALGDFYWNYAGDYSGFAASLFYKNEATFIFDENGMLLAADYFTGEGRDVDTVYYELGEIGGFSAGASAEDFELPASSASLKIFMMFVRLMLKLMVQ